MNKLDHEEFENYLEGDSDLSRAYAKLSKEEPSSDLDNAILEQARHGVNDNNVTKIKRSLFSSRLDSPLAMAAVVVLCVSLVLLVQQDETLLENTGEINSESFPVVADEADQQRETPAMMMETSKPELIDRVREKSLSVKKELQQKARMDETRINETQNDEKIMSVPASAPVYQSEIKQKTRQDDQFEKDTEISASVTPLGAVQIEAKVAKRQLVQDVLTADQLSPEVLSEQIKSLIHKDKIEKARSVYKLFIELFPEQPLAEWFTDQEMMLLDR